MLSVPATVVVATGIAVVFVIATTAAAVVVVISAATVVAAATAIVVHCTIISPPPHHPSRRCDHPLCSHCRLLSATLVAGTIPLAEVAIALFIARHPHCHHHRRCRPRPCLCPLRRPPALLPSPSPTLSPLLLPSPTSLSLARHPRPHCSCRRCHCPLRRMPPSSPTQWPVPPSPSLSPAALVSGTITLATLTLFVSAVIIRCALLSFVVVHRCGRVVVCHRLPFTLPLLVDCCHYPTLPILRDPPTEGGGGHIGEPVKSPLSSAGQCVHGEPTRDSSMVGKAGTRMSNLSSGVALIASRHPPLRRLTMVGCCVL
jgi:hypothetical protein